MIFSGAIVLIQSHVILYIMKIEEMIRYTGEVPERERGYFREVIEYPLALQDENLRTFTFLCGESSF